VLLFFCFVDEKITARYFYKRLSNPATKIELEAKMKKTNLTLNLVNAEVNVNIDITSNVNLGNYGKRGGGGGEI
jgi:hypothetical protein